MQQKKADAASATAPTDAGSQPLADSTDAASGVPSSPSLQKKKSVEKPSSGTVYYRITVRDNGCGMRHDDIPLLMGRVLSGTKYGVKQQRGRFGLGAKMALIWSQMSTGCPITIRSATSTTAPTSYCKLHIDITKNVPNVLDHRKVDVADGADGIVKLPGRGTEVSVVIEGNFVTYRSKILNYMRQLAVITPYGHFELRFVAENEAYERQLCAQFPLLTLLMLVARLLFGTRAAPKRSRRRPARSNITLRRSTSCS